MQKILFILFLLFCFSLIAQDKNGSNLIDSLNSKGNQHYYFEKDSAYFYFDKVYSVAQSKGDSENLIQSLLNSTGVASYHHDLIKMSETIAELDSLIKDRPNSKNLDSDKDFNILLYYTGIYQLKLYENTNSRKSFEQIIENVKNTPDSLKNETLESLSSAAYSFLGKIYLLEGKFELAKQLYKKNVRNILDTEPVQLESLYGNYNLLAEVYLNERKYREANKFWLKTFGYNKKNQNTNMVISTAFNLAENYNQLSKKDSALHYLAEARSNFNDNPIFYPKYHLRKADIHKKNEEYQIALKELNNAINEARERLGKSGNYDVLLAYNEIGDIHTLLGKYQIAIKNYNLGLQELGKNAQQDVFSIKLLKNKSLTQNKIKTKESFLSSIRTVDEATQILNTLKPTFKSQADKLVLIEDAFPLFESGLEAVYQLYQSSKEEKYINQAFEYAEKSKSVLLLEALLGTKATQFANIPKDILERERQLKSEITFVEKQLNRAKEETSELEDQLFALREEHRQLIKQIENDYKTYYDLKYNTETFSLPDTQKRLASDEKMISYFYGNHAIYAIAVDKVSKQIERIPIGVSFENDIKNIHRMLSDPKSDIVALSQASYKLYASLVAPFMTSEEKKRLIIISDGLLNYIPFGALNTSAEELSYLTEHHAVSYANSATLLAQLQEQQSKNVKLLAFAPSFEGAQVKHDPSRGNLLPLPHNKREVEQILGSFKGRSFLNKNASLQNFTSQLSNFGMLHLATHAVFDDESPEYSYLAFSNVAKEEDLLYVSDLYNLQIDANLVTLSACESGVGELKRGEGFMSLARGFFYSGASSIASTLWKINDASTTKLMDSFYKNLAKGEAKDRALQKSQIEFLNANQQNGLSHPYYWSGFVISGNTAPLVSPTNWIWIALTILALAIIGFVLFRKRKKA